MKVFAFPKSERISGRSALLGLLEKGKGGSAGCLRFKVLFREPSGDNADDVSRIMVSVPKKQFRRAVKRNLLKRRMRESYRLQKPSKPCDILFIYISREVLPFDIIYKDMGDALSRIAAMRDEQNA